MIFCVCYFEEYYYVSRLDKNDFSFVINNIFCSIYLNEIFYASTQLSQNQLYASKEEDKVTDYLYASTWIFKGRVETSKDIVQSPAAL